MFVALVLSTFLSPLFFNVAAYLIKASSLAQRLCTLKPTLGKPTQTRFSVNLATQAGIQRVLEERSAWPHAPPDRVSFQSETFKILDLPTHREVETFPFNPLDSCQDLNSVLFYKLFHKFP